MEEENEELIAEFKFNKDEMKRTIEYLTEKRDKSLSYSKKEELSIKFQKLYDKIMILLFVWLIKILFIWLIS